MEDWLMTKSTVRERLSPLLRGNNLCDITFNVGTGAQCRPIKAHKLVLSAGSRVFDKMFNGPLASSGEDELEILDTEPQYFVMLLKFLYSDEVELGPDTVVGTLHTAKKYDVPGLEKACIRFLKKILKPSNAIMIFALARQFEHIELSTRCLQVIDKNTSAAISAKEFTDLHLDRLCMILERDYLVISEISLFKAVIRWSKAECIRKGFAVDGEHQRLVLGRAIKLIRFPLMAIEDFAENVCSSGILLNKETASLYDYFMTASKPPDYFSVVPRRCVGKKEKMICRFRNSTYSPPKNKTNEIQFSVNRRIFLSGLALYGGESHLEGYEYKIIHTASGMVLGSDEDCAYPTNSTRIFRVKFKEQIEISPNIDYTIYADVKGTASNFGLSRKSEVTFDCPNCGKVTFKFKADDTNGQVPEIMFYA